MSSRGVSVSNSGWRREDDPPRPDAEHAGLDAEGCGQRTRRILCGHRRVCEPNAEKIDKIVMEILPWIALESTGCLEISEVLAAVRSKRLRRRLYSSGSSVQIAKR